MLSGKRAFRGDSMAETMSAILREDPPDLSGTNKTISPALERVMRNCLEKNPAERFHSARDLAFAIECLSGSAISSGQTTTIDAVTAATNGNAGILRLIRKAPVAWIAAGVFAVLPSVEHCHQKYQNNRMENSHQPMRLRERLMRRFKSSGHAQRFLSVFGLITSYFRVGRHRYRARGYRVMKSRFALWDEAVASRGDRVFTS